MAILKVIYMFFHIGYFPLLSMNTYSKIFSTKGVKILYFNPLYPLTVYLLTIHLIGQVKN